MQNRKDIEKAIKTSEYASDIVSRMINDDDSIINELQSDIFDYELEREVSEKIASLDKDRVVTRLHLAINKKSLVKSQRKLFIRTISVTAALIAVSFVIWNSLINDTENNQIIVTSSVNIAEPTIILSSGKTLPINKIVSEQQEEGYQLTKEKNVAVNYTTTSREVQYNSLVVPSKYTSTIILSDGSEITLNAGSTLKYPTAFSGTTREVELTGEAYFKVKKDDKPFIVKGGEMQVKVYGTEFNVKIQNHSLEALLVSGSVGASVNNEELILEPKELFAYNIESKQVIVKSVNIEEYLGWLSNDFYYVNTTILSVLTDISNWYNVEFKYDSRKMNDTKINLFASKSSSLEEIIDMLEYSSDMIIINEGGGKYSIEKR